MVRKQLEEAKQLIDEKDEEYKHLLDSFEGLQFELNSMNGVQQKVQTKDEEV